MAVEAQEYDVVVVGAGVAGGALATVLGRDGRRVLCVERDLTQPERIVGELLQPGGYEALCELGLRDAVAEIDSQDVYGYGIFLEEKRMMIDYSPSKGEDGSEIPHIGKSFHNGRFVRRLRELAQAEANVTLIEGNVKSLLEKDDKVVGVNYSTSEGKEHTAFAKMTIACDGCFSRLRKKVSPPAEYKVMSQFYGLVLSETKLPFPEHGHVVLADPAPVLFYPISSHEVRCLVDVPGFVHGTPDFEPVRHMREQIAPQLPPELKEPFLRALEERKFKSMPNRVMPAQPAAFRGAILLGDSFNMRHPLTGGGMTVALNDVKHIRELLREVDDFSDYDAISVAQGTFYEKRQPLSSTINILANALYSVFCANGSPVMRDMRIACFDYLCKPGRWSEDPISMLGGLKPYPYLLVAHFFGVAVYACGRMLRPLPTPVRLFDTWELLRSAFNIVKPLIDAEGVTVLSKIPISRLGS